MKRYEDAGLQFADAALAHLAERENIRTVFTTDRRDFSIIRLKRNRMIALLPEVPMNDIVPGSLTRSQPSQAACPPTSTGRWWTIGASHCLETWQRGRQAPASRAHQKT